MKKVFGLIVFIALLLGSCRKDEINLEDNNNQPDPTLTIEASVYGIIKDASDNPIEGAMLTMGSNNQISDENGYFNISGFAEEGHGLLKVSKQGFYDAFPVFNANERKQYLEVELVPREVLNTILSSQGGSVRLSNGAEVNFAANGFTDESGQPYNGDVKVYLHYLDPSLDDIAEFMPGDLSAFDINNEATLLTSMGMINVQLEGAAGQTLDINQAATIKVPVPASLLSSAPLNIPLWYFDEDTGYWMEEGSAVLNNGLYTGTVEHFTFWNCDVPNDFVNLEGQIINEGVSANATVKIIVESTGDHRSTKTDVSGYFEGKVPNGVNLTMEFIDQCGAVVYTQDLGALNSDTKLDPIWLEGNNTYMNFIGSVVNCDGEAVQNGYVRIQTDLSSLTSVINVLNGSFEGAVAVCDAKKVTVTAYDIDDLEFGSSTEFDVVEELLIDGLVACGNEIEEGVLFEYQSGAPLHIIGCDAVILQDDAYKFTFTDNQPLGKVTYDNTFINWSGDLDNPQLEFTYSWTGFDTIDHYYEIIGGEGEFVEINTEPGSYLVMKLNNCIVNKKSAVNNDLLETNEGVNITFTGLVQ